MRPMDSAATAATTAATTTAAPSQRAQHALCVELEATLSNDDDDVDGDGDGDAAIGLRLVQQFSKEIAFASSGKQTSNERRMF
ncbi:hypothetical protein ACLKA6_003235 [Drosophila palustris]